MKTSELVKQAADQLLYEIDGCIRLGDGYCSCRYDDGRARHLIEVAMLRLLIDAQNRTTKMEE